VSSRRHTVIISDVHLSQAHPADPSDPLWMRYRLRDYHPDEEYAGFVDHLLATRGGDAIELVYNGDVFDFDAPWVKDGTSSFDEFPLDDAGCADHIRRILRDHDVWLRATARLLLAGHRLLIMSGNHDVELHWPGVRRAIREEIARVAPLDARALEERVRFRAWFHVTEDGIYIEHGSQYDMFSCVRYPMLPVTRTRDWTHPQMGKLAFKRTGSRMGYFNPYYEETFYLGFVGYMRHWYEFYARSHRHVIRTWFWGGLRTVAEIWRHRHGEDWSAENRALARAETGARADQIDRTAALFARSADRTMIPILRELWLDRVALLGLVVSCALAALALGGARAAGISLGVTFVLGAIYEIATPKPDLRTYDSAPHTVRTLFEIHGARAICLGHTHRPFGAWDDGDPARFYGNSGSWCPAFRDQLCTQPVLARRPLLVLTSEGGEMWGGLHWWDGEALAPEQSTARAEP
jgi:UDP-2,3-diacylglucosamine pyrophosphatase LpxH